MARYEPGFVPIVDGEVVSDETARADQLGKILNIRRNKENPAVRFSREEARESARDIINEETIEDQHPVAFGVDADATDLVTTAITGEETDLGGGFTAQPGPTRTAIVNLPGNVGAGLSGVGDRLERLATILVGVAGFVGFLVVVYVLGQLFNINVGDSGG